MRRYVHGQVTCPRHAQTSTLSLHTVTSKHSRTATVLVATFDMLPKMLSKRFVLGSLPFCRFCQCSLCTVCAADSDLRRENGPWNLGAMFKEKEEEGETGRTTESRSYQI